MHIGVRSTADALPAIIANLPRARVPSRDNFEAFGVCAQTTLKIRPQEMRSNAQLLRT